MKLERSALTIALVAAPMCLGVIALLIALLGGGLQPAVSAQQAVATPTNPDPAAPPTPAAPPAAPAATPAAGARVLPTEVDIVLVPSRDSLTVGDLWAVIGEVHNRSNDKPIWIVDTKTILVFSPEVYGATSDTLGIFARFSTLDYRPQGERTKSHAMKIEPGSKYSVIWRVDPKSLIREVGLSQSSEHSLTQFAAEEQQEWWAVVAEPLGILANYSYFYPGNFRATMTAHVWYEPPIVGDKNEIANFDRSFTHTVSRDVPIGASPWVLMVGAAIGGVVSHALQHIFGLIPQRRFRGARGDRWGRAKFYADIPLRWLGGFAAAVLLPAVATVLLARLSTSEFPISISVRDIWGGRYALPARIEGGR